VHAVPARPSASRQLARLAAAPLWVASLILAITTPLSLAPALANVGPSLPTIADRALGEPVGADAAVRIPAIPGRDRPVAGTASRPVAGARSNRDLAASRVPVLRPPVDGPLVRGFEELAGPFGPGHRGVDFGAAPGSPVRAPASGRVTFAGAVARTIWVTMQVAPAVLVTLGPLRALEVPAGQTVAASDRLGTLERGHDSTTPSLAALHLSLRVDGVYVDPLPWLAGLSPPRLAPLSEPGGPH
jgi:murein DD-endopeptidase MepM/ murein hydrolase activator NlpD